MSTLAIRTGSAGRKRAVAGSGAGLEANSAGGSAPQTAGVSRKGAGQGGKRGLELAEGTDRDLSFSAEPLAQPPPAYPNLPDQVVALSNRS